MLNTFITLDNAKRYADERANACEMYFSVFERINLRTRDFEFMVVNFIHENSIYVAIPNGWPTLHDND